MKTIKLTQQKETIVDDQDFDWLNQWRWIVHNRNGKLYAARGKYEKLGFKKYRTHTISMHRVIMNAIIGQEVDHINGESLDNRRVNLRLTDRYGNNQNARVRKDSLSGYKGVCFYKSTNKWRAYIGTGEKLKHIGYFNTPQEAALAYNQEAIKRFGEYAKINNL